eukprot:XP_001706173.1 Hypothetical protein GL50803_39084 [Giardia lamblia ATCC 50803]
MHFVLMRFHFHGSIILEPDNLCPQEGIFPCSYLHDLHLTIHSLNGVVKLTDLIFQGHDGCIVDFAQVRESVRVARRSQPHFLLQVGNLVVFGLDNRAEV